MDEYVKREAVKEWLRRWEGYIDIDIIARMQYRVIDIPAADPPVKLVANISFNEENLKEIVDKAIVKCKDCKHWNELLNICGRTKRLALGVNGFCSMAERKE